MEWRGPRWRWGKEGEREGGREKHLLMCLIWSSFFPDCRWKCRERETRKRLAKEPTVCCIIADPERTRFDYGGYSSSPLVTSGNDLTLFTRGAHLPTGIPSFPNTTTFHYPTPFLRPPQLVWWLVCWLDGGGVRNRDDDDDDVC